MNLYMQNSKNIWIFYGKITLLFILFVGGTYLCNLYTDSVYSKRHYGSIEDKLNTLKTTHGGRTIFVGGSSVLTGVNAEHYEKISGEQSINMGLHAADIYDVYLSVIEPYIHQGDKVVLALEYYPYNTAWNEYDDVGLIVGHESKEYYKTITLKHRPQYTYQQILRSYAKVYEVAYSNLTEGIKGDEEAYLRDNITKYGDLSIEINMYHKNPYPYQYNLNLDKEAVKEIKRYIEHYETLGAKVYIVFPPIYTDLDFESDVDNIDSFYRQMRKNFGDRVLGYPTDWMFNTGDKFWDTGYHLISSESLRHTEYYYNLIKEAENLNK